MFLSDQLIQLGLKANPKSNMSQGEASRKMLALLNEKQHQGMVILNLINITKFAVKVLKKKGFTYYSLSTFFDKEELK